MAGPTDATRGERKRARPHLLRTQVGLPCPRCGETMRADQRLQVGHTRDVVDGGAGSPLRLEHALCNQQAGDRRYGRRPDPPIYRSSRNW